MSTPWRYLHRPACEERSGRRDRPRVIPPVRMQHGESPPSDRRGRREFQSARHGSPRPPGTASTLRARDGSKAYTDFIGVKRARDSRCNTFPVHTDALPTPPRAPHSMHLTCHHPLLPKTTPPPSQIAYPSRLKHRPNTNQPPSAHQRLPPVQP